MKNLSVLLSALSLAGFTVLFSMCKPGGQANSPAANASQNQAPPSGKLAYVNVDSLEAHYELLKQKRDAFKKHQEQVDAELNGSYQQMQTDAAEVQKKAQAQTLTQSEYETAEKRLMQMQQSIETRKQSLTEQLMKEQDDMTRDLKSKLDAFLEKYNRDKHYDFIFSYSAAGGSGLMYANKQLDITKDVIDGMNAASKDDAGSKK